MRITRSFGLCTAHSGWTILAQYPYRLQVIFKTCLLAATIAIAASSGMSAFASTLTIGEERPISAFHPAPAYGDPPVVASTGDQFAAVWFERMETSSVLHITIHDLSGEMLLRRDYEFPVMDSSYPPAVALCAGHGEYLFVWTAGLITRSSIITRDGVLLNPAGRALPAGTYVGRLAFNGSEYLLAWTSSSDYLRYSIKAMFLGRDGAAQSAPFEVSSDGVFPALASDGESFFVVWQKENFGTPSPISGALVSSTGAVGTKFFISETSEIARPAVDFDGENYLVLWQGTGSPQGYSSTQPTVTGVTPSGKIRFELPLSVPADRDFDLAWSGSAHLVVTWDGSTSGGIPECGEGGNLQGEFLSADGTAIGRPFLISSRQRANVSPRVAGAGGRFFAAWHLWEYGCPPGLPRYIGIDPDRLNPGVERGGESLSRGPQSQSGVNIVAAKDSYLSIWMERTGDLDVGVHDDGTYELRAGRISADGTVLDGKGILFQRYSYMDYYSGSAVASDGTNFLVVATSPFEPPSSNETPLPLHLIARLFKNGSFSKSVDLGNAAYPKVAFGGGYYGVIAFFGRTLCFLRVTPDGSLVENSPIPLSIGVSDPSMIWDGQGFVVAWRDEAGRVIVNRVGPSGALLSSAIVVSRGGVILAAGPRPLVLGNDYPEQWYALLDSAGTPSLRTDLPTGYVPSVAVWDGNFYLIFLQSSAPSSNAGFVVRVSASGSLLDREPLRVIDSGAWASAASAGRGESAAVYQSPYVQNVLTQTPLPISRLRLISSTSQHRRAARR